MKWVLVVEKCQRKTDVKYFVKSLSEEVEMNLLSEEVKIYLSFFLALSPAKCLQEQEVCEMVENDDRVTSDHKWRLRIIELRVSRWPPDLIN